MTLKSNAEELALTGERYDDETEMLSERKGVSVSLVDPAHCLALIDSP